MDLEKEIQALMWDVGLIVGKSEIKLLEEFYG